MAPPKILCVDDEPLIRRALRRIVEGMGVAVETACNGEEALARLAAEEFSLCITDLRMPTMGGAEMIRRSRALSIDTLFLVVTGMTDASLRADPRIDEVLAGVLEKPWGQEGIVETIERALELYAGRRATTSASGSTRLLLIEDCDGDAQLLCAWLEECPRPVEVDVVRRVSDAVSRLHDRTYDFLISDLTLPDARGLDAVSRLQRAAPEAALVVLTGLDDEELAAHALRHGAQDFLQKTNLKPDRLFRALRFAQERKHAQKALLQRARYDELTGLANRATLHEEIEAASGRARRGRAGFSLLFLDLDGFKGINDNLGHDVGDALLQEVGRRLKACSREQDTAARLGGDEFVLLLDDVQEHVEAEDVAKRILGEMARPFRLAGQDMAITTSIGGALYPGSGRNAEDLLRAADEALYAAKRDGKNVVRFHEGTAQERGAPAVSIKGAVARGELRLHYQEHVALGDGRVLGYEGLLRWETSDGRVVPPAKFLSHLESSGEIVAAGQFAIGQGLCELSALRQRSPGARMSLNVSAQQLEHANFVATVERALGESGLEGDALELELSEAVLLHTSRAAVEALDELTAHGVRLTIDDFGAGHGSLAHLMRAPVQTLKLDAQLAHQIEQGARALSVVRGLLSMANDIGLLVIAKGVERRRQVELLQRVGCAAAQGFYFGAPRAVNMWPVVGRKTSEAA